MRAPYYKVYLGRDGQNDISEFVSSFVYEDCLDEDNMVELSIHKEMVYKLLDDEKVNPGTKMYVQFGFMGEVPSKVHIVELKDIDTKYTGSGESLTLRGLDKGVDMKKESSPNIWKNMTSSQIATEIAKRWTLLPEVEPTTKVWENLPQGNRSDIEFLRYLAGQETDGNFITYIRNERLFFVKRNLTGPSIMTYWWKGGLGDFISFEPKYRESTKKKGTGSTKTVSVDPKTKKTQTSKADNDTEKGTTTLGEKLFQWDGVTGKKIGLAETAGKIIPMPPKPKTDADNVANAQKKKADLKVLTATMRTLGNPNLGPNLLVSIAGTAERHSGNWIIKKVRHSIAGSGYECTSELEKNGSKKGGGKKAKKKNTQKGPDKAKATVKVSKYDGVTGKKIS